MKTLQRRLYLRLCGMCSFSQREEIWSVELNRGLLSRQQISAGFLSNFRAMWLIVKGKKLFHFRAFMMAWAISNYYRKVANNIKCVGKTRQEQQKNLIFLLPNKRASY